MTGNEIRKRFLEFFKQREHIIKPSGSLIPEDPSVLLTIAGMLPLTGAIMGIHLRCRPFGIVHVETVPKAWCQIVEHPHPAQPDDYGAIFVHAVSFVSEEQIAIETVFLNVPTSKQLQALLPPTSGNLHRLR